MDFDLSEEQQALRATVRALLDDYYGDIERRNAAAATDRGWNEELWKASAELGVLALPFDEEYGGMGAGPIEVSLVMEEIGRVLAPEPLLDAVLLPGSILAAAGTDEQRKRLLGSLADGSTLIGLAHEEPGSRWPDIRVSTAATESDSGVVLTGRKSPVAAGDCVDSLIVSARYPDGKLGLFLVDARATGVTRNAYRTHDERRGAEVVLDGVAAEPLGSGCDVDDVLSRAYVHAQVAQCAEAIGAMREALRLTVEYLKQRKQFGVPLSTFQALTHRCADMFSEIELANSLMLQATAALADGEVDPILASRAKFLVGQAAVLVGQEAVQMHGGIGITTEHPIIHFLSRLTAITHTLGAADDHLRVLASTVSID